MEIAFEKEAVSWLEMLQSQVQNLELTQELRLPEAMPDVGRVLACWGQPMIRSREWYGDSISAAGGIMAWVLYQPEGGTPQTLDVWIPFQTRWSLPEDARDGTIRTAATLRFLEGRSASPRKITLRAGVALLGQALCYRDGEAYVPGAENPAVALRCQRQPLRLLKEAGEKTFLIEEPLSKPAEAVQLAACTLSPQTEEVRVLGDKLALRGTGNLHMVYLTQEGRVCSRDEPVAFSQYAELDESYGTEAQASVRYCVGNLETELVDGEVQLRCSLTAQYLIDDVQWLETVTDAYAPGRLLEIETAALEVSVVLDSYSETAARDDTLNVQARELADITVLRDCPKVRRGGSGLELEIPAGVQLLYYDREGKLQSTTAKWESTLPLRCDEDCRIQLWPRELTPVRTSVGETVRVQTELSQQLRFQSGSGLTMVKGVTLGQMLPRGDMPSLILCRAGEQELWELAKASGSRMEEIQKLNRLEGEPAPGTLLLIPVS